jgi:CyaY protein
MSAAPDPAPPATPLSDADYEARAFAVLDRIEEQLDDWLDDDVIDIDSHRTGGLLEMSFPDDSKIIINTQPPLQELWLATRAGGYHFRFCDGLWLDTKTSIEFHAQLSADASSQGGMVLAFKPA